MNTNPLHQLIGRKVSVMLDGWRIGQVIAAPSRSRLTVQFMAHGKRIVHIDALQGVFWRGRRRTLAEYLELRAGAHRARRPD